ncbi:vacuolar protein sorting 37B [Dermatophagoides pteronyssinus]|uniref:Vacuolar protein sorting-associated protein 37B-like n=1 Tax=Dermatophagoides pteronyssinus TaxID=6956 RepID=A0A6P6YB39_DERPT|nr:vacuolar protein sorting-associated protein 37B-like [Dermatophagoides pteronyssinus]
MAHFYSQNDLDISSINSLLKNFTNDELDSILNDQSNERIEDFIRDLPQIKTLERERERLIEENKQIAENNLSFESTYRIQRQQLTKAFDECQQMKQNLDRKKSKLKEFGRQHSLDTILALMQAAMAEAEESSDEVANSLLRKELTIDEFLKDFNEKRKLFHMRRIKAEKMPEEIRNVQSSMPKLPGAVPWRQAPAPPSLPFSQLSMNDHHNPNNPNNNPPYPTNPFGSYFPYPQNYQ